MPDKEKTWYEAPLTVIAGTVVCAATVFTVGYTTGKDAGQAKLEVYETASKLDFPKMAAEARDATASMKQATDGFSELLASNTSYAEMKSKFSEMQAAVDRAAASEKVAVDKAAAVETELAAARQRIQDLTPAGQEVKIAEGETFDAANEVLIGLSNWYQNFASIVVNGESYSTQAGGLISAKGTKGGECEIKTISLLPEKTITFRITCKGP